MNDLILVTGATGNVGAEVVRQLMQQGQPFRAAVTNPEQARAVLGNDTDSVIFEFGNPSTYAQAFKGVRAMFLMRPPQIVDVKRYIYPAIDMAREAGVEHIVFLSLQGVEKNPFVPHHKVENYLQKSGVVYTFLRPSFFMQNLSTTHCDDIRLENQIFVPAGRGKTSFIDVRDVAAVATKVLTEAGHENCAYELTGTEALSYDEVAQIFSVVLERPIRYANPSALRFWRQMRRKGYPTAFVMVMIALYTVSRLGLAAKVTPETARLLGRSPISMQQFVADYATVWQAKDTVNA